MLIPHPSLFYKSYKGYEAVMRLYDALLRSLPIPCESQYVSTRHGKTHVLVAGPQDAPPVVLTHGWSGNALSWRYQLPALAERYRVYAPDTIGQSGRSAGLRPSTKGPAYGHWLLDVFDELHIKQANMIGISGGGWLVLRFATVAPERIRRAILISTAGIVTANLTLRGWLAAISAVVWPTRGNMRNFLHLVTSPNWKIDMQTDEEFYTLFNHFKVLTEPPRLSDAELRQLRAPTWLLMGVHEFGFRPPEKVIARARKLFPNLRHAEVMLDVGHMMTNERPKLLNERLLQILDEPL
jgi:pimeloyl-ACP methyl ester carboxylesterase